MNEKEFDYLNVIPLVDVMLVLLTIVLTTSTFIVSGRMPVQLPQASRDSALAPATASEVIEISRAGEICLNGQPSCLDDVRTALATRERTTPILIRADRHVALQVFVDVLDTVKALGFTSVGLQTENRA